MADASLQTGQSLLLDAVTVERKPMQLTKQTSTTHIPESNVCQGLMTDQYVENVPTQETIKVLKTTDGSHDVIEIATKNVPTDNSQEQAVLDPSDIIVDMKYQDAHRDENALSELSIQHLAPQSFEAVVMEPDDIRTEVVVDEDGTKRIIVRKLRKTLVTNRKTCQQHVSSMSTTVGDGPPIVQAFSEATLRGQQITVTKVQPDGTIGKYTRGVGNICGNVNYIFRIASLRFVIT